MIKLYLIRHGETEANKNDIVQGHCDYPLTELGIKQAQQCGIALQDIQWDYIYSSDLYRAYHTCCLLLSQANKFNHLDSSCIIYQTNLLRELNFGVRENLPRSMSKKQAKVEVAKRTNIDVRDVVDISESMKDVYVRQVAFLTSLGHQLNNIDHGKSSSSSSSCSTSSDKMESSTVIDRMNNIIPIDESMTKVLCVAHGGYIKSFLRNFCKNITVPDKIQNCAVSIITIDWPDRSDPTVITCMTSDDLVNINYYDNQL